MPGEISQSSNGPPEPLVVLTCVYCGHEYPPGTPAAMHPMRAVVEERDRLLTILRNIEWAGEGDIGGCCPECGNHKRDGHREDCELGKAIKGKA